MRPSPLELCCWSTARSPKRRRTSSPSVLSRSQRGNTALSVPRRSSARSGSRHSGEPGGLSPWSQGSAGGSGLCSGIRDRGTSPHPSLLSPPRALFLPCSYEFLRRSLIFYRNEIQKMTGKDPLEQYGISEEARFQLGTHRQ
uniref:Uncharacterized protein n=1 Tax=Zosterops lateralis melanops TaxID=1220523 RepID=A0A8D2NRU5_ZOSLA